MEQMPNSGATAMPQNPRMPAALAYVLFVIPWFFGGQNDPSVRFHINQAFGLFLFGFLMQGFLTVIGFWGNALFAMYGLSYFLVWAARIIYVVLGIYGLRNALAGKREALPYIGKYFPDVFV